MAQDSSGGDWFILAAAGHEVRVLTRKSIDSAHSPIGVRYFQGDLTGAFDLSGWLRDVGRLVPLRGRDIGPFTHGGLACEGNTATCRCRCRQDWSLGSTQQHGCLRSAKIGGRA